MNQRMQEFVERHQWAAMIVAAINWIVALFAWTLKHADDLAKFFALASSVVGLIAVWYTMRIKRRQFIDGEPAEVSAGKVRASICKRLRRR